MNREEILERSRYENRNGDEREHQIKDKTILIVYLTMVALSGVFAVIRGIRGDATMDLGVIVCGSVAAGMFVRFARTRNRQFLILAISLVAVAIGSFVGFLQGK